MICAVKEDGHLSPRHAILRAVHGPGTAAGGDAFPIELFDPWLHPLFAGHRHIREDASGSWWSPAGGVGGPQHKDRHLRPRHRLLRAEAQWAPGTAGGQAFAVVLVDPGFHPLLPCDRHIGEVVAGSRRGVAGPVPGAAHEHGHLGAGDAVLWAVYEGIL